MTTLGQLGAEKYVLLTTYRKDGRAVPTPLWVVPDGPGLAFWTPTGTGKLKRIRNNGRVTVQPCDFCGNLERVSIGQRILLRRPAANGQAPAPAAARSQSTECTR